VTAVAVATAEVVTVKVLLDVPTGTVIVADTLAAGEFEDSFTTIAPLPPGVALSVTVPVALVPPVTLFGEMLTELTWKGLTVRTAV